MNIGQVMTGEPVRETAATQIMAAAANIASRGNKLRQIADSKLAPISQVATPEPERNEKAIRVQTMPPLFDELAKLLSNIGDSIDAIQATIDRVEI